MLRLVAVVCTGIALTIPSGAHAQSTAPSCATMDLEDAVSIRTCVDDSLDALRARKGKNYRLGSLTSPKVSCVDQQMALARAQLTEKNLGRTPPIDASRNRSTGKTTTAFPSCEVVADVVFSLAGEYPVWVACLGWRPGLDHVAHATACLDGTLTGLYANSRQYPLSQQFPTTCAQLEVKLDAIYANVNMTMPGRPQYQANMPLGWPAFVCAEYSAYLARNAQLKEDGLARLAAEEEERRRLQSARLDILAALDADYDFSDQRAEALARRQARVYATDAVVPEALHDAVAAAIHLLFPAGTERFGGQTAVLSHTTHGIWLETDDRPKIEAAFGIKSIDDVVCAVDGRARCSFVLTVSESIVASGGGLLGGRFNAIAELVGSPSRSARFDAELAHNGTQWRISRADGLAAFLAPAPVPTQKAGGQTPEECLALQALGAGGC